MAPVRNGHSTPRTPACQRASAYRHTQRRLGVVAAFLCLLAAACRPPTMLAPATPAAPGASQRALVAGRIQLSIKGRPVRVGPEGRGARVRASGLDQPRPGSAAGLDQPRPGLTADALTMIVFRNVHGGDEFGLDVPDDTGGFEVLLPPGQYAIRLRYEDWLLETPAILDAPAAGAHYYVGTLRVDLFRRSSIRGWWARAFGGSVPRNVSDFAVTDDEEWARGHLRAFSVEPPYVQTRLMSVGRGD